MALSFPQALGMITYSIYAHPAGGTWSSLLDANPEHLDAEAAGVTLKEVFLSSPQVISITFGERC
jgi:hypothetical protein